MSLSAADFWAGYLSGAAGIIIGNPLDLLKVRVQASSATPAGPRNSAGAFRDIRTLIAGLPAPVLTYGALNALLFTSYTRSLGVLSPEIARHTSPTLDRASYPLWNHFASGCVAGLATWVLSAPTEYVKCRAQVVEERTRTNVEGGRSSARGATSSWAIARETFRKEGVRGLYLGGGVTSLRDSVGYGFYFYTYELCRGMWDTRTAASGTGWMGNDNAKVLLCGGVAGVMTWVSIYPLDVIKTRVQTQGLVGLTEVWAGESAPLLGETRGTDMKSKRKGAWKTMVHAYQTEGMPVFFRGLTVCCIRAFVVNAVQWAVYEWAIEYLVDRK